MGSIPHTLILGCLLSAGASVPGIAASGTPLALGPNSPEALAAPGTRSIQVEKALKPSAYFQFQFRDTNQAGAEEHAWSLRRARIGATYTVDDRTSAKFSFDAAAGSTGGFELKDLILTHNLTTEGRAAALKAGQFTLPLGYELERSSNVREFPERSKANRSLFPGERVRGAMVEGEIADNVTAYVGLINSLTVKDKESNASSGSGGQQSGFLGVRFDKGDVSAGVGYLVGRRPAFTGGGGTSPEIDRNYLIADAGVQNVGGTGLFVRGEVVVGKDRIGSSTGSSTRSAKDLDGYHFLLGYKLDGRNQLFARYGTFDPDTDASGNLFKEYGVGYRYFVSPSSTITAAFEVNEDPSLTPTRFNVATLRWQVKF